MVKCFTSNSSAVFTALLYSLSGKVADLSVTAATFFPSTDAATFKRNVLSTPPEKATTALPYDLIIDLSISYFFAIFFCGSFLLPDGRLLISEYIFNNTSTQYHITSIKHN